MGTLFQPDCAIGTINGVSYAKKVMIKIYLPPPNADKHSIRVVVYICKDLCKDNITGLCGNYDGDKDNDLETSNGVSVPATYAGYKQIANSYNLEET